MQQAVEYYNNKLYSQAISTATKELVLRKNDFHLLHLRANCYTALREYKKALVDLKVLIINYPTEHRAYFKAVKCFRLLKDYRNLEKIVNAGIQKVKDVEKIKELKLVKITTKEKTRGKELILPVELMTFVFWYLPLHTRLRISRVCKYWRSIVLKTTLLWREVDLQDYNRKINGKNLEFIINITKDRIFKLSLLNCSLISDLKALITHRCRNIIFLDLSNTRIGTSGLIDALKCMGKSLQELILQDTRVDDLCLTRVFDICRCLKVLNISKCPLVTSEGLNVCDKFKQANISLALKELVATHTDLSNLSISKLVNVAPSVSGIDLTGCPKISSNVLNILAQYSGWKSLILGGNSFTSTEFKINFCNLIRNCSALERLECPKTPYLDDNILSVIGKSCPALNHVNFKGCAHISGSGIIKLSNLLLSNLNVSKCPKISEESLLVFLESDRTMTSLEVSSVSDKLLDIVKQKTKMHSLSICDGTITNRGIIDLAEKPGVKWQNLHFSNCQKLSREAVSHLSSLVKGCKVTAYFS